MLIPKDYHSALSTEKTDLKELDYFTSGGSTVLCHDLNNIANIPAIFYKCDAIYSEIAWRAGYNEFIKRADKSAQGYNYYLISMREIIKLFKKPAFIVGGRHALKLLKPDHYSQNKLHGVDAILMIWNHYNIHAKDNASIISYIAKKYETILDFSCGYGCNLHAFRHFIASDINRRCVYYIAKKYLKYTDL